MPRVPSQEVDVAALVGSGQAYLSDAADGAITATEYGQEQEQVSLGNGEFLMVTRGDRYLAIEVDA